MTHWTELRGEASYLRFLEMEGRIEVTFAVRKMVRDTFRWRIDSRAEWSKAALVAAISGGILSLIARPLGAEAWLLPFAYSLTVCALFIMGGVQVSMWRDRHYLRALDQWRKEWKKEQKA